MNGNRRIFYDKLTGDKIHEIGRNGSFTLPTIEQDIATWSSLSDRNRDTFDVLELTFDDYEQDFSEGTLIGVDLETKIPRFSYPDPNNPEVPIVAEKPLTVQIAELKAENLATMEALADVYEMMLGGGV
jgi:hypothetical protein